MWPFSKTNKLVLTTPKEKAIQDITDRLISWSKYSDKHEIITAVLKRTFPFVPHHIHRNPRKKEAA